MIWLSFIVSLRTTAKIVRSTGGLHYDILETWSGVAFPDNRFLVQPTNVETVAFGCNINFLIGTLVMEDYVFQAAKTLIEDEDRVTGTVRRQSAPQSSSQWQIAEGKSDDVEKVPNLAKMFLPCFKQLPIRILKMLRQGGAIYSAFVDRRNVNPAYAEIMDRPLIVEDSSMDPSLVELVKTDIRRLFIQEANQQDEVAPLQAVGLLDDRVLRAANFWPFLDCLVAVSIYEGNLSEHYDWMLLEDFSDKMLTNGDTVTRVSVSRQKNNCSWFGRDVPDYLLLKLQSGSAAYMFYSTVLDSNLPVDRYQGYFDIEYVKSLAADVDLKRLFLSRRADVEICKARPRHVVRQIVNDLQLLPRTDKQFVDEAFRLIKKGERQGHKKFTPYQDIHRVPASMLEQVNLQKWGMRTGVAVEIARKAEMQILMRDRFLSFVESLFPGASCDVGREHRLLGVDGNVHVALDEQRERVIIQYNKSLHQFFAGALGALPLPVSGDRPLSDICSFNNEVCTCEFGPSDFAQVILQRIRNGERVIVMEGPVGCGKTYSLCQTVKLIMDFLRSIRNPDRDLRGIRNVPESHLNFAESTVFVFSTTNSNVEITKEYLASMIDPSLILHLHAKRYTPTVVPGVKTEALVSRSDENGFDDNKHLMNIVAAHSVILCTVDLAVSFMSRLRLVRNVYALLDEAAQVNIRDGLYLSMFSDTYILFGDTY